MSFGAGHGTPFGGGIPVPVSSPVSEVGGDYITFDFSDDPDGPLPGKWAYYILTTDGGVITGSPEPDSLQYFRVSDGLGWWRYQRAPQTGSPFEEHGVAASPLGILQGRNAELAVAFRTPLDLFEPLYDGFYLEVTAGLRTSDDGVNYIGARVRSEWAAGSGWTTPVAFEIVQAAGAPAAVLASATWDHGPKVMDLWRAGQLAEVRVRLRGSAMEAWLSGAQAHLTVDPVTVNENAQPIIVARIYRTDGSVIEPIQAIAGIQLKTLRDLERLGAPPQFEPRNVELESPPLPMLRLPLRDLVAAGHFVRTGSRTYRATEDVEVEFMGQGYTFNEGVTVRSIDPIENQDFVTVAVDYAGIRSERER